MPSWLRQPEKLSGFLTVLAIALAFAMANSPLRGFYELVHHTPVAPQVGALMSGALIARSRLEDRRRITGL